MKQIKAAVSHRVARWYIFKQKYQFWYILDGLAMEDDGLFYGQRWYIL
jgi:hypothetical protein